MRYLRLFSILFLIVSVLFTIWANIHYLSKVNRDKPVLKNNVEFLEISVEDDKKNLFSGLSAYDATDGDLTDKIMIASTSHFIEKGTVKIKYVVFDSHNNSTTLTRKVKYTDYYSPEFELEKAPVYVKGNSFDLLDYIKVTDAIDGDISDRIRVISNAVSNFSTGVYPVILEVSNSYGDTARVEIMVTYLDKKNTVSINLHKYLVYIEQDEEFNPMEWIDSVTIGENKNLSIEDVTVQGNLDTNTPGFYQLSYNYVEGDKVGQSCITVVVTERSSK